jgi:hypothetical protein
MLTSLNVIIFTDGHPSDDSVFAQSSRAVGLQLYGHLSVRRENYSSTIDSRRSDSAGHSVFFYISNIIYCPVQRHATSVLVGLVTEVKLAVIRDETRDSARSTDRKSVTSG